jgi:hypothetical protein
MHLWRNDQLFLPVSFCRLDCLRQSAHFAWSFDHFFFAAAHCFFDQVSTCVAVEGCDCAGAVTVGAGLGTGGELEDCALAAPAQMITEAATAIRQDDMRDIDWLSSLRFAAAAGRRPHGRSVLNDSSGRNIRSRDPNRS